jgi:DNA-binding NarL/FixJ family response regulator
MTLTLKSKRMQSTDVNSKRPRLFRDADCAVDSLRELATGNGHPARKPPKITAAEHRVLALVARARTNKEIALDLGISPATVKRHIEKILRKLALRNRVEAAIFGLMLNGCPHESSSGCFFQRLRAGADRATLSWTD